MVWVLLALAMLPALAGAQAWPQKPVRMIVPFAAGGGTDFIARLASRQLSQRLGQQFVVENRAGANGIIGLQALKQSEPDGYTIAAALYEGKLPYDTLRDFVPVGLLVRFPGAILVHPSVPARSVGELLALARAKPNGLAYSSWAGVIKGRRDQERLARPYPAADASRRVVASIARLTRGMTSVAISSIERLASAPSTQSMPA
jgi:tripartite-type tricarboxylate transporter receptor subunit TctC